MSYSAAYPTEAIINERARWIARYKGLFGDPPKLDEFTRGEITFRELYDTGIRFAENMIAEAQTIHSMAFMFTKKTAKSATQPTP